MKLVDNELKNSLTANAEAFIKTFSVAAGFDLSYNEESVKWMDQYLNRVRHQLKENHDTRNDYTLAFSAFLGEVFIRLFSGEWVETEYGYGVEIENTIILPFNKVEKHIENGEEDSVYYHFLYLNQELRG